MALSRSPLSLLGDVVVVVAVAAVVLDGVVGVVGVVGLLRESGAWPNGKSGTRATLAMECDLRGSFPARIVDMFLERQTKIFSKLTSYMASGASSPSH